jgi:signal transduction histidine kinase
MKAASVWSRLAQIVLRGHIQHRRIRGAAYAVLAIRLLEGAACWAIVLGFYSGLTVAAWAVDLDFAAYAAANLWLFTRQRRSRLTPGWVWFDIAANVLPMAVAAHWSGGIYSPLLPTFVLKIASYGLIYGVDIGLQSLAATTAVAVALAVIEASGLGPNTAIEQVPLVVRQRLTLAFEGLIFGIIIGGGLRFFSILQERESRLAETVGEKDSLYQQSLQHQAHLRRLSQSMMQVSERTMHRLARELHDDLGQALTAVRMDLGLIDRELAPDNPMRSHVREAREQIGAVLQSVRNLSQLLRPPVLDDLGLIPAMQSYITRFGERTRIPVTLDAPPVETRLPRSLEVALYRVLQEALTNVARHANARQIRVRLQVDSEVAMLEVTDDGVGFDAASFLVNPPSDRGMGVIGMRERVATYGGQFTIGSQHGAGTRVALVIPLAQTSQEMDEDHGEDSRLVG